MYNALQKCLVKQQTNGEVDPFSHRILCNLTSFSNQGSGPLLVVEKNEGFRRIGFNFQTWRLPAFLHTVFDKIKSCQ